MHPLGYIAVSFSVVTVCLLITAMATSSGDWLAITLLSCVVSVPFLIVAGLNSNFTKEHTFIVPSEIVKLENGTVVATYENIMVKSTEAIYYITPETNLVIKATTGFNAFHKLAYTTHILMIKESSK